LPTTLLVDIGFLDVPCLHSSLKPFKGTQHMISGISKLLSYKDYIFYRVFGNLVADARKYFLSYIWWVFEPLLEMLIYVLVFSLILSKNIPNFPQFLLVGITTWRLFHNAVMTESNALLVDRNILTVVYLPKSVIPAVVLGTTFIKYLISFFLLCLFLFFTGFEPSLKWIIIPWVMGNVLLLSYGVGCIFAALVPFLPDLKFVINTGLRLGFFMSGIFYDIRSILPQYSELLMLNPIAALICDMRLIMIENSVPDFSRLSYLTLVGVIVVVLGIKLLETFDHQYPRVLQA